MGSNIFFKNQLKPADLYVTARQLTGADSTAERGEDSGIFFCKAIYPTFEYGQNGQKTQKQIGWSYQCTTPKRGNVSFFIKVHDMNRIISDAELTLGPVSVQFTGFRGVWWVNKKGFQELSCKAEAIEKAPLEVY